MNPFIKAGGAVAAVVGLLLTVMSVTVIPEGHVGVVTHWGVADRQINPGLHFVNPITDGVREIEIRQRKNTEEMAAATANQLPVTAMVSVNWTVDKASALDLFVRYGGLDQFQERILNPKLRSAAKAAISKFPADVLIRDRNLAVAEIQTTVAAALEGFPVSIDSPQIENITLPAAYMDAVMEKEKAREAAQREAHTLERQNLVARQSVNTANAEKEAAIARAEGEAQSISLRSKAEAEAIQVISEQLRQNPAYIELVRAKAWDGKMPGTILGDQASVLLGMK
jgi:regulator of protease activity HflC (stomatin/prohibitin superfamily)